MSTLDYIRSAINLGYRRVTNTERPSAVSVIAAETNVTTLRKPETKQLRNWMTHNRSPRNG